MEGKRKIFVLCTSGNRKITIENGKIDGENPLSYFRPYQEFHKNQERF